MAARDVAWLVSQVAVASLTAWYSASEKQEEAQRATTTTTSQSVVVAIQYPVLTSLALGSSYIVTYICGVVSGIVLTLCTLALIKFWSRTGAIVQQQDQLLRLRQY